MRLAPVDPEKSSGVRANDPREHPIATDATRSASPATSEARPATGGASGTRSGRQAGATAPLIEEEFFATFVPVEGYDYGWVVKLAKERYDSTRVDFKNIDDKAAHLMTYLGSGTGIVLAASLAGVTAGQVSPWVALLALPAFGAALFSLGMAAHARSPRALHCQPSARNAAQIVADERYKADAEACLIPTWTLAASLNQAEIDAKAGHLSRATWALFAALALLVLPMVAGIVVRFNADPPKPPAPTEYHFIPPAK